MSVIVWDGKTLAADRQATSSNLRRTTRKIWRHDDILIAGVGTSMHIEALRNWVMGGLDPESFPDICKADDVRACLTVINRAGRIVRFENGPFPVSYEDEIYADGSGRDFAYGAMAMGADARKAVEVASTYDVDCGHGVDTLSFDEGDAT